MTFEFHPEAAKRFDEGAVGLVSKLHVDQRPVSSGGPKDLPVKGHITDKDILAIGFSSTIDVAGRALSKSFLADKTLWTLDEGDYAAFEKLCDQIANTKPLKGVTSPEFIRNVAFEWIERSHLKMASESFTTYVIDKCNREIKERTLFFPIDGMFVRCDFRFGQLQIAHCSPELFEKILPEMGGATPQSPADREQRRQYREKRRQQFQGKPIAQITIVGDAQFALEDALDKISVGLSVFNLFLGYPFRSDLVSYVGPHGLKPLPQRLAAMHTDGKLTVHAGPLNPQGEPTFTGDLLTACRADLMFDRVSEIVAGPQTEFERAVLHSLRLMGAGCYEQNASDRLVYTMVALESLLLSGETEPIQESIADRLALSAVRDAKTRQQVVTLFKQAYAMRSKFVHHGRTIEERRDLDQFFQWALFGLLTAVRATKQFKTRADYIAWITGMKYQ